MAGVNFSFDLGPVTGTTTQDVRKEALSANEAAAGARFQSVQQSLQIAPGSSHPVVNSPACDGSSCFIVHGDGPGVTTLSIGEEDGGVGDFVTLPVVDGSGFIEPPVHSFASAGDYEITTLAIGEEDGGGTGASPEIGTAESSGNGGILDYVEQTTIESYAPHEPVFVDGIQTANVSETYGIMEPIYSSGDTQWGAEPYAYTEPQTEPDIVTPIASAETVPTETLAMSPRLKPATAASVGSPLPEVKPAAISKGIASVSTSTEGTVNAAVPAGGFVSVGDYDSYIASSGGSSGVSSSEMTNTGTGVVAEPINVDQESATTPDLASSEPASAVSNNEKGIASTETMATPQPTYVIQENASETAASQTIGAEGSSFNASSDATDATSPQPAYVIHDSAEQGVSGSAVNAEPDAASDPSTAAVPEPAYVIQENSIESGVNPITPRMKPASAMTPDPVYTINSPTEGSLSNVTSGTTFSTIETPAPLEKPAGFSADAPKLSEEDYRITTLALGEEEAGGG